MVDTTFTSEIPSEWWSEAGMGGFKPSTPSYASDATDLVRILEIQPPSRNAGVRYFERARMIAVLKGFVENALIPPIEVNEITDLGRHRYQVHNGFHRFYASLAAGFEFIPIVVKPYFDLKDL